MAWNKPSTENQQKKPSAKTPSAKRGIIAGAAIVVALGALCLYLFTNGEATSSSLQKKEREFIKEVTPAAASRTEPIAKKGPQPDENGIIDPGPPPNFHGSVITNDNGTVYYSPDPGFASRYNIVHKQIDALPFKTRADFEIASILGQEPGTLILETAFPLNLEEDFIRHLDDPIVDKEDDTEEIRNLKQMMREVKPQLKAAMDRGEKLADLLSDYRRELSKAYSLKENLSQELERVKREATSEDEVKDYINAANEMLDKYGVKHFPVVVSPALRYRLQLRNQEKGKEE